MEPPPDNNASTQKNLRGEWPAAALYLFILSLLPYLFSLSISLLSSLSARAARPLRRDPGRPPPPPRPAVTPPPTVPPTTRRRSWCPCRSWRREELRIDLFCYFLLTLTDFSCVEMEVSWRALDLILNREGSPCRILVNIYCAKGF